MKVSTHTIRRLVSVTGLVVVVSALAVPTALARPTIEGGDSAYRTPVALDLRSPDTRDVKTLALSVDPAIATAMTAHERLNAVADLRSPDTRDVTANPVAEDAPVAAPPTSDDTNWGLVAAMAATIGLLFVGVGALAVGGHGKRHGTVKPA